MVVAVQGRNDLAVIDPVSFTVTERIPTPGCDHPHGQALDVTDQVMFVGCEANATMVTVDLANRNVIDHHGVGETPDVLAYDPGANRVYVAAESGWVSIFDHDHGHLTLRGSAHLADGAHSLALDPRRTTATFRSPRITTAHQCCGSTNPPEVPTTNVNPARWPRRDGRNRTSHSTSIVEREAALAVRGGERNRRGVPPTPTRPRFGSLDRVDAAEARWPPNPASKASAASRCVRSDTACTPTPNSTSIHPPGSPTPTKSPTTPNTPSPRRA